MSVPCTWRTPPLGYSLTNDTGVARVIPFRNHTI